MAKFTCEMVDELADKLLIGLTAEENKMVLDEFNSIDEQINIINEIPNISEVEKMTHCLDDFVCELREDEVLESSSIDDILSNCDDYIDTEIKVPKVVGNNESHE